MNLYSAAAGAFFSSFLPVGASKRARDWPAIARTRFGLYLFSAGLARKKRAGAFRPFAPLSARSVRLARGAWNLTKLQICPNGLFFFYCIFCLNFFV